MSIQGAKLPRVNGQPLAELSQTASIHRLNFRGQTLSGKVIPLTLQLFCKLGFNPRLFSEGAKIFLLDKENYEHFGQACGIECAGGFYPLAANGDVEAVIRDEIPFLPNRSRVIVLAEDHPPTALAHEILHDIFVGGGLELRDRQHFTRELLYWYRLSLDPKMPHQHKNRPFYEKIAKACARKYNLQEVSPLYCGTPHWQEYDFRVFASECFAYAGEYLLFSEKASFTDVPDSIIRFLKFVRVIDPSAIRQAGEQV
jgi:hypothetical protein